MENQAGFVPLPLKEFGFKSPLAEGGADCTPGMGGAAGHAAPRPGNERMGCPAKAQRKRVSWGEEEQRKKRIFPLAGK